LYILYFVAKKKTTLLHYWKILRLTKFREKQSGRFVLRKAGPGR